MLSRGLPSTSSPTPFSVHHLRPWRVWHRLAALAQAGAQRVARARHVRAQRAQQRRVWSGLNALSPHALRDIGAPDWMLLDAADRRDAARLRHDDISRWRGV
ncbi:MAG: hypothetical protein AD742_09450 [Methylibium sp. NZG]|nr:MAG: hypothetical protein AD742_09450 [Methylibium sp. NZG]